MIINDETKAHAQEIVDYIIEHPEQHNQNYWWNGKKNATGVCGTTLCAAGTSIFLKLGFDGFKEFYYTDGSDSSFESEAGENLGLENWDEQFHLFHDYSNERAFDKLVALANGDEDKFWAIKRDADAFSQV